MAIPRIFPHERFPRCYGHASWAKPRAGFMACRNRSMPKQRYAVATVGEIASGQRKLVEVDGRAIGIFNVAGTFIAVLNVCPHELAPIFAGRVSGTTLPSAPGEFRWGRDGEILSCPWHGWE